MKVIMKDVTLEMTVEEYIELQQLGNVKVKLPEEMNFGEEWEFINSLRHFKIESTEMLLNSESSHKYRIVLVSDTI